VADSATPSRPRASRAPSPAASSSPSASRSSERARGGSQHQARPHQRQHRRQQPDVATGDRPDDPEAVLVERVRVEQHDDGGDTAQQGGEGDPGEQQRQRAGAAPPAGSQHPDGHGCGQGTSESADGLAARGADVEQGDADDDRQRRARRHPEQPGVSQRIARQPLQLRASQAQSRPDDQPDHRARQPQLADDDGSLRAVRADQGTQDVDDGQRAAPDRQAHDGNRKHQAAGRQHDESATSGARRRTGCPCGGCVHRSRRRSHTSNLGQPHLSGQSR
jgi:hypothetical protein